jgi:uncharacterized protein (TIGR03086 family)
MAEHTTAADLRLAAAGFERSMAAAEGKWDQQSPCTDWKASDVVDHLIGTMEYAAHTVDVPVPDVEDRGDKFRALVDGVAGAVEANPAMLDEPKAFGDTEMPAFVLLGILTTDVLVHTWDLGRAAGLDVELDEELSRRSLEGARPMESMIRKSDMFGDAVPVADDAPVQHQMLGFFGRDPAWSA